MPFSRVVSSCTVSVVFFCFFFFNDTATTEIYTLSLHDALPIYAGRRCRARRADRPADRDRRRWHAAARGARSEEHTSELQSLRHLVCRLLLEKKKKKNNKNLNKNTRKQKKQHTACSQQRDHRTQ